MKLLKISLLLTITLLFNSCASNYQTINPQELNYFSNHGKDGILLEYQYDLLEKKYKKKENKKGLKLVAIKIKNYSEKDIVFGKDFKLTYENGDELIILENVRVFKSLKQNTPIYLLYLLLTGMRITNTHISQNSVETNSIPIGLIVGPGLAGSNMVKSSSANRKFKTELREFDILSSTIKKGETIYGLIGVKTNRYDSIKIKIEKNNV